MIATVTENLGGVNQSVMLTSYDAWGKARLAPSGSEGASCYSKDWLTSLRYLHVYGWRI